MVADCVDQRREPCREILDGVVRQSRTSESADANEWGNARTPANGHLAAAVMGSMRGKRAWPELVTAVGPWRSSALGSCGIGLAGQCGHAIRSHARRARGASTSIAQCPRAAARSFRAPPLASHQTHTHLHTAEAGLRSGAVGPLPPAMPFQSLGPKGSIRPSLRSTGRPAEAPPRQRTTLRRKFILTMLVVSSLIGITTLVVVLFLSTRSSDRRLHEIETSIQDSITSKGKILTQNHSLALRSMVLDNAFLDMQSLIDRAVNEDADLVYGLFTNAEGDTLALKLRGSEDRGPAKDAWKSLGFQQAELAVAEGSTKRSQRVGQEVVEVAVPLFGEEKEALGTLRYGLSTQRMHQAIAAAKADARVQQLDSIKLIGITVTLTTLMGILCHACKQCASLCPYKTSPRLPRIWRGAIGACA